MKATKMKATNLIKTALYGAIVLAGLMASGCVSSSKVSSAPTASVGQQLQDLDKSYKDGIISKEQYTKLKKALIKKND